MFAKSVLSFLVLGLCAAAPAAAFELTSPTLAGHDTIPMEQVFTKCGGSNVSPALAWSDPPAGTKSFAVTLFDPDARKGAGWWHWGVVDIPASVSALPAGAGAEGGAGLPAGAEQLVTSFGTAAYGGPCPPAGDPPHHYLFTIYALKTASVEAPPDAAVMDLDAVLKEQSLGSAQLVARFGR